jgi:putative oxidoreductase
METRPKDLVTSIGLLILRVGVGGYLASHGWGKLQMLLAGEFEKFGDPIGLGAGLSLGLVVFVEFVCSLMVMLGLATRLAAIPVVVTMVVAAAVAHGSDPWTMEQAYKIFMAGESKFPVSKEPALLFLVPFLALVFTGAGQLSLDALIWPRLRQRRAGQVQRTTGA